VSSKGFFLTRFPIRATQDDYAEAAAELDSRLDELPERVAVYRFGSVQAPGISDLDRIAVVEEGGKATPEIWSRLSARTQHLAMHAPFLIDASTFARHRWFADLGLPELVSGGVIEVEERPVPEHSEPLLAAEALVVISLKLAKQVVTGRVKVRPLLCELNNLTRDLELGGLQREDAAPAWALAGEIGFLRKEWWKLEDSEQRSKVQSLLEGAPLAIGDALAGLARQLDEGDAVSQMALGAEWSNVTLVPGIERNGRPVGSNALCRFRRLGEARWQLINRRFQVPEPVLQLLSSPLRADYEEFRLGRAELVRRHSEHLISNPGYSSIGFARVYLA
jgi:hypothetical protein